MLFELHVWMMEVTMVTIGAVKLAKHPVESSPPTYQPHPVFFYRPDALPVGQMPFLSAGRPSCRQASTAVKVYVKKCVDYEVEGVNPKDVI